jgi:hypothetical protein
MKYILAVLLLLFLPFALLAEPNPKLEELEQRIQELEIEKTDFAKKDSLTAEIARLRIAINEKDSNFDNLQKKIDFLVWAGGIVMFIMAFFFTFFAFRTKNGIDNTLKKVKENYEKKMILLKEEEFKMVREQLAKFREIDIRNIFKAEESMRKAKRDVSVLIVSPIVDNADIKSENAIKKDITDMKTLFLKRVSKIHFKYEDELNISDDDYDIYFFNNSKGNFEEGKIEQIMTQRNKVNSKTAYFYYNTNYIQLRLKSKELEENTIRYYTASKASMYGNLIDMLTFYWILIKNNGKND